MTFAWVERLRRSRPTQRLAATPAAVALVAIAVLSFVVLLASLGDPRAALEERANASIASGDYATARIWFQRLLVEEPANPRYRAGLAVCDARMSGRSGHSR